MPLPEVTQTPLKEATSSPPAESAPPGRGQPGLHVRDPRESVCGDGEASRRHAGDDPVQREGKTAGEDHQVPGHPGDAGHTLQRRSLNRHRPSNCTELHVAKTW